MKDSSDNVFCRKNETKNCTTETRYNRDERLKNASEKVKQLHDPDYVKRRGIVKTLIANKGFRAVFIIIVMLATINMAFFMRPNSDKISGTINGIPIKMDYAYHNNELLVTISFHSVKDNPQDFEINAFLTSHDGTGYILEQLELSGIYIGQKLVLNGRLKTANVKMIRADIISGSKFITLENDISKKQQVKKNED